MEEVISPYHRLIFAIASSPFILVSVVSFVGCFITLILYLRNKKKTPAAKFIQLKSLGVDDVVTEDEPVRQRKGKKDRVWTAFKVLLSMLIIRFVDDHTTKGYDIFIKRQCSYCQMQINFYHS